MKGTAHIVVKDKYGNIKTNITEHNTITDAYKNRVQAWLNGIEKYQNFGTSYKGQFPATTDGYFNGIFVNEKTIADDKDIPIPAFIGGQVAKSNSSNNMYSVASTHTADDTKIQNTWAWTADKAYTIKSLALKDATFANNFNSIQGGFGNTSVAMVLKLNSNKVLLTGNSYQWQCFGELKNRVKSVTKNYGNLVKVSESYFKFPPLYSNEIALLSSSISAPVTAGSVYKIYVFDKNDITDYSTATPKRSFALTQFEGLINQQTLSLAIIPTEQADYLFFSKSETELFVYKIPRSVTEETIPKLQTITTTRKYECPYALYGRTLLWPKSRGSYNLLEKQCALIRVDYDTASSTETITYKEIETNSGTPSNKDYDPYNYTPRLYYLETATEVVNPYVVEAQNGTSQASSRPIIDEPCFGLSPTWHNHTILNLATPISLAEGDVLTVSYTISVGE